MAYKKDKLEQQDIAVERILILMKLAGKEAEAGEDGLAGRHVKLARAIGMRYNVRIPKDLRGRYCKYCSAYFTSKSFRTRINSAERNIEVKCVKCGRIMKFRYK
jgi:ribonuclease P protein subunit RPR2